jgi:serine/threonine protein phosphatase PrpC
MSNSPDANKPVSGGLQAMLARLKGMVQTVTPAEAPPAPPESPPAPESVPAEADEIMLTFDAEEGTQSPPATPTETPPTDTAPLPLAPLPAEEPPAPAATLLCPVCGSSQSRTAASCADCGYYFSPADLARSADVPAAPKAPAVKLQDRFELKELLSDRQGVARYHGLDYGAVPPTPVVILRQELPKSAVPAPLETPQPLGEEELAEEIMPSFDDALLAGTPPTAVIASRHGWPGIAWERKLLTTHTQPGLPQIVAYFQLDGFEYLVEEVPLGRSLYDAWDDPDLPTQKKYALLAQVAETMYSLHQAEAMLETLRPGIVIVTDDGQARLTDLSDLLPLPIPADVPLRGTLYTAPELMAGKGDPRAVLYSFGGLLYSLHVGRELQDIDFDRPGNPKPFIPRFPDVHPSFGRLMSKTFRREPESRFPTDEAVKEDATGFVELIRTLNVLGRTMDLCRLEIAAWTTIGMVRTGNEDAYALLHATETRQDDASDAAILLLADGMGGYEAGEVAAALAIQIARQVLTQQKPFTTVSGQSAFPTDPLASSATRPEGHAPARTDVEVVKQQIKAAIKEANKQVFTASRAPGSKRRGMGCTLEVVYVDGRNVIAGHVGDSRTYHLHEGQLVQLTRDQTLVNRLLELGMLTAEEAETHPRRNELQQAVGGQPDVEPGLYHGVLRPGDWVLVCSDGLTNHINSIQLKEMMLSEAQSAEQAARRLVNFANIEGATDNATVIVVRAT